MKSSTPQKNPKDGKKHDDKEARPAQLAHRPSLARSPPGRLSDISSKLTEGQHSPSEDGSYRASDNTGVPRSVSGGSIDEAVKGKPEVSGQEGERIDKMRDAANSKLLQQQRLRRSFESSPKSDTGPTRVSPIQEEDGASSSPSLAAKLAAPGGPVRTSSTVSTESTESTKTVRASQANTPAANASTRTPSYPFPHMPGTPKDWSTNFHQPFTGLSPTVGDASRNDSNTPHMTSFSIHSGDSTPAATNNVFMPPGLTSQVPEDPRFPTPNLYEMVLQLNAEPGLEQWWATVTNLMHDHFKAERATLVMPQDPTDIENVPWGQKATFSMNGPEEFVPHRTVLEQTLNASVQPKTPSRLGFEATSDDIKPQKLHPERLRPRLEARHSYAGHGRETKDTSKDASAKKFTRPAGPQRTATHAAGMPNNRTGPVRLPAQRFLSTSSVRQGSLSDPEFSSIAGGVDAGPYAEMFPTLQALDHEVRPLIEPGGVNRVLDRGRVVTVTRDYMPDSSDADKSDESSPGIDESGKPGPQRSTDQRSGLEKAFGNYRSVFASDNAPSLIRDYEEYEQYPASPWSQSPAPSPAIQADEEENPFFASEEKRVEDSFSPAISPKDYTQFGQVEAIGVDHASTVIHVPLVHPTISQPMQSLRTHSGSKDQPGPQRSNALDMERKAPMAILSVLSSNVPYPHNLTQSLRLLGPHLATSFSISQQFSSTHSQAVTIRHRRTASGHGVIDAPMTIEPASLQDIMKAEIEGPPGSVSGSVTSPSDYSGRSGHSPTGSIVGTPGWDPATHGWTSAKSVGGTPGLTGSEIVDNYFEAKKRSSQRNTSHAASQGHSTPARPIRTDFSSDVKHSSNKPAKDAEDGHRGHRSDSKPRSGKSAQESQSPKLQQASGENGSRTFEPFLPHRPPIRHSISHTADLGSDRRHSQLHSYGADLHASFGGLPATSSLDATIPESFGHGRKSSFSDDMPPPSERLLRTIIDSVPVQIFTAEPETGRLTWVNTKFLIYRGQEAHEVLHEPWQAIHPEDRNEFMTSWHRSLRTTQQLQQKVRLQRFDESYRWFYVRAAPLKDKRQKVVHWIGTMMDFHEQHIAEVNSARQQETAASEAKYRALANSSPQIVFAASKSRGVTFCNTQWVQYSGQSEVQAHALGFMDHVHPEDLAKCKLPTFDQGSDLPKNVPQSVPPDLKRKTSAESSSGSSETEKGGASVESSPITGNMPQRKLSELAGTGILKVSRDVDGKPSYSTEVRLKSKDGEYRWHLVRVLLAEPLLQSDDEETWYGTCTDINDHKALERDLKETMDEKSRFLSNMSHEIRTPLNGITGMVNFLIDSSLTAEQMEHVNIIRASTEGLRGLINDILDLSKAEAGMIQLNMEWLYVRALIEEVNDLTSAMAIDKGLELNYIVEEDVPIQVKGDRFRIRQILLNIVGNAIKFTQNGEVFVRCSKHDSDPFELAEDELFIKFEIIDTGRGFTDEEADHLFKRFSQIDGSSTRQHGGTGLGLVISRQLAQLHGGDMSAKGVPGKGATFMFSIKTTLPSASQSPGEPSPSPSGVSIPILPVSPGPAPNAAAMSKLTKKSSNPTSFDSDHRPSPKFALETSQSPSPYGSPDVPRESPSVSSASSDPSLRSTEQSGSIRSERSSASSYMQERVDSTPAIKLALPPDAKAQSAPHNESKLSRSQTADSLSPDHTPPVTSANTLRQSSANLATPDANLLPPMYSILVLCPLKYSREATVRHIDMTLPKNVPHQITARETLSECQELIGGDDPLTFTHIVVVLHNVTEITALMSQVLGSPAHQSTSIVIITDLAQRKKIMEEAPNYNYNELTAERRLRFVFKPLKPSRFAIIFDPQKEREMSLDRNQDSAQQVALTQKQVFEELKKRLGNRGKRVLLVEDNKTNQLVNLRSSLRRYVEYMLTLCQVVQKFLKKVSIDVEIVVDGVECTDRVFSRPFGYYSIILCDLHMPNKDGYQTCKEIRKWEREKKYPHLPIIALSANVLGDVFKQCVSSEFNSVS